MDKLAKLSASQAGDTSSNLVRSTKPFVRTEVVKRKRSTPFGVNEYRSALTKRRRLEQE